MKVMEYMQKITDIGKSPVDKKNEINVGEVWSIWDLLVSRYDIIETTQLLDTFTNDIDLKTVINRGLKLLDNQTKQLENLLAKYSIPLPIKPPEKVAITHNIEEITDRYIFRRVFRGIQSFLYQEVTAFVSSSTPEIREFFKSIILQELELLDQLISYGKIKSWLLEPPKYG